MAMDAEFSGQTSKEPTQGQSDDSFLQLDEKEALEADPRGDPFQSGSPSLLDEALADADSNGFDISADVEASEAASPPSDSPANDANAVAETAEVQLSTDEEARQAPEDDTAEATSLSQHASSPVSTDPDAAVGGARGSAGNPACESEATEPTSTAQPQQPPASADDDAPAASAAGFGGVAGAGDASPAPDVPEPALPQHQHPPAEPSSQACSSSPTENGDFDDFGDFGGFEDAQPTDTHPVTSSTHTPVAPGTRDAASEQPPSSASPGQHVAASSTPPITSALDADDDFGDFGDFEDFEDARTASSATAPAPASTTTSSSSWALPPSQQPPAGPPATPAPDTPQQEGGNILLLKDAAFLSEVQHRWADLAPLGPPPAGSLPQGPAPAALLSALRSSARAGAAARNTVVACNGLPLEVVARSASVAAGASSASSYATDTIAACRLQWKGTPAEARLLELLGLHALGSAATVTSQDSLRSAAGGSSALVCGHSEVQEHTSTDGSAPSSGSSLSWSSYEASTAAPFAMPSTFPGYKPQDLLL